MLDLDLSTASVLLASRYSSHQGAHLAMERGNVHHDPGLCLGNWHPTPHEPSRVTRACSRARVVAAVALKQLLRNHAIELRLERAESCERRLQHRVEATHVDFEAGEPSFEFDGFGELVFGRDRAIRADGRLAASTHERESYRNINALSRHGSIRLSCPSTRLARASPRHACPAHGSTCASGASRFIDRYIFTIQIRALVMTAPACGG